MIHRLRTDITLDRSRDESFAIFADAGNLEALTPPFEPLGRLVHPIVRSRLDRIFAYREAKLHRSLNRPTGSESLPPRALEILRAAQHRM